MNNERDNKIEQVLSSLDGNQQAVAPDFFYTRLKARMEKEQNYSRPRILRPAYVLATLIIVLVINIAVILKGEQATENNNSTDNDTEQSIAAAYNLNDSNAIYDLTPADNK